MPGDEQIPNKGTGTTGTKPSDILINIHVGSGAKNGNNGTSATNNAVAVEGGEPTTATKTTGTTSIKASDVLVDVYVTTRKKSDADNGSSGDNKASKGRSMPEALGQPATENVTETAGTEQEESMPRISISIITDGEVVSSSNN